MFSSLNVTTFVTTCWDALIVYVKCSRQVPLQCSKCTMKILEKRARRSLTMCLVLGGAGRHGSAEICERGGSLFWAQFLLRRLPFRTLINPNKKKYMCGQPNQRHPRTKRIFSAHHSILHIYTYCFILVPHFWYTSHISKVIVTKEDLK